MVEQPLKLESTSAAKSNKKEQKEHLAKKHHHKSDSGADKGMCLEMQLKYLIYLKTSLA